MRVQGLRRKSTTWYLTGEFDPLDVKKVSESQKCAQGVLGSNERHIERLPYLLTFFFDHLWNTQSETDRYCAHFFPRHVSVHCDFRDMILQL